MLRSYRSGLNGIFIRKTDKEKKEIFIKVKKQRIHRIVQMKRLRKSKFRKGKDRFSKITSIRSETLTADLGKCHNKLKVIIKEIVALMILHRIYLIRTKLVKVALHYIIMMNKWKLNQTSQ